MPLPCRPYVARYIEYLLGTDDEGHVTLLGRGPLRLFISSLVTGERNSKKDSRYGNPNDYTGKVTLKVPGETLKENGVSFDLKMIREIEEFAIDLMFQELAAHAKVVRFAQGEEGTIKQMLYQFMDDIGVKEDDGLNYENLKRRLNRYEKNIRWQRRSISSLTSNKVTIRA